MEHINIACKSFIGWFRTQSNLKLIGGLIALRLEVESSHYGTEGSFFLYCASKWNHANEKETLRIYLS